MSDKILVTRSSMPPFEEYAEEIRSIWETRWLTNSGAKHQALEAALREYFGVSNVGLCVNGHLALECIFEVLELQGEVITTPFTFVSTTNAIVRKGCTPVYCDVNERDYTIEPEKIEALITEKTVAILPVHVYGALCNDDAIEAIARRHGLKVIYDAAHAFGVKKNGVSAAALGDASMFSFHATKVFHTIEGGAAVFRNAEHYQRLQTCKNFGMTAPDVLDTFGGNAKMNEFAAAMGLCNLRHIDEAIASRKEAAERYRLRLSGVKGLQLPAVQEGVESNYAYFPVIVDPARFGHSRDQMADALAKEGIGARKYFYPLTNTVAAFGGTARGCTPVAQRLSEQVLCLPIYEGLGVKNVDRICDIIQAM